jgi:hypothetical protein
MALFAMGFRRFTRFLLGKEEAMQVLDHERLDVYQIARQLIVRIVSMLFKLTKSVNTPDSFPPLPKRRIERRR